MHIDQLYYPLLGLLRTGIAQLPLGETRTLHRVLRDQRSSVWLICRTHRTNPKEQHDMAQIQDLCLYYSEHQRSTAPGAFGVTRRSVVPWPGRQEM